MNYLIIIYTKYGKEKYTLYSTKGIGDASDIADRLLINLQHDDRWYYEKAIVGRVTQL